MGYRKSSCKREVYSNTSLLQETRKILNKQPKLILEKKKKQTLKLVEEKKS